MLQPLAEGVSLLPQWRLNVWEADERTARFPDQTQRLAVLVGGLRLSVQAPISTLTTLGAATAEGWEVRVPVWG